MDSGQGGVKRWLASLAIAFSLFHSSVWADEFLDPEQAFVFSAHAVGTHLVRLHWKIENGYHLYRDRLQVQVNAKDVAIAPLTLPSGKEEFDGNFNKRVSVYRDALDIELRVEGDPAELPLTVGWQGCADSGLCYPPTSQQIRLALNGIAGQGSAESQVGVSTQSDVRAKELTSLSDAALQIDTSSIASTLASGSLMQTVFVFWVAGLLLAFTPCVLPMLPILSSLIAGQRGPVGRGRGFALACFYSLGMALVYAGFGVAAGLAGEGLAAALQNPWVLGAFAGLLVAFSLSMFGFYELQMPGAIQSKASDLSNRFRGGSFIGVFLMGGVSALVVGPCVAAPLAGALVYISQTRDVLLGGLALFSMAIGMSVPLLLLGLSAGSLLPKAGAWMEYVKQTFGMMLLGVAIWMVSPVLPITVQMLMWASWLVTAAAFFGLFGAPTSLHSRAPVAARASGAVMVSMALMLLVGAASGGQSVLQPLAHLRPVPTGTFSASAQQNKLQFERISNTSTLDGVLAEAKGKGQTVMLDFYADWCVSCKEYESFTFSHPDVQKRLEKVRLVQADVTANREEDKALLKRFNLFGPPGVVIFSANKEVSQPYKVVGYQAPTEFLASLNSAAVP